MDDPAQGYRKVCDRLNGLDFSIRRHQCGMLIHKVGIHGICKTPRMTIRPIGHNTSITFGTWLSQVSTRVRADFTSIPAVKDFVTLACATDI